MFFEKISYCLLLGFFAINLLSCQPKQQNNNQKIEPISLPIVKEDLTPNSPTPELAENQLKIKEENITLLETILQKNNQLEQAKQWQYKALFIKVNPTQNSPKLTYYYYQSIRKDTNNNQIQDSEDQGFFNPASTVKVGISTLTLEKLHNLNLPRETKYKIAGTSQWYSLEEDIKKALVISDNQATNRLILFLGFNHLNSRMNSLGFNYYSVNRLMLNQGTLVDSPAFELKFQDQIIQQPPQKTTQKPTCFEVGKTIGNCATARDLAEILMALIQPEFSLAKNQFNLREEDRLWLQKIMSKKPRELGFNYENTFCRFLDPLGNKIAHKTGKLLSKCGVGLFSHTFVDTSFLETDQGAKYYLVIAVTPPSQISQTEVIKWFNITTELILNELNEND